MTLHSEIAARIRCAAQLWSCDPDDCPLCDCGMTDEMRKRIHDTAEQDAKDAIEALTRNNDPAIPDRGGES